MKNLLLVGATGYIGQHIRQYYENSGWSVTTLGRAASNDIVADICSHLDICTIVLNKPYDRLIHAAAINEVDIAKNLSQTYAVNVTATRILLEFAKNNKIKEFVYISTFHVYGQSSGCIDEHQMTMPINDYGLTHLLSEEIVIKFAKVNQLIPLIIRPTNVYGVPVDIHAFNRWSLIPFAFVRSAVCEGKIELISSGYQMRNFVDITDVVKTTELVGQCLLVNAAGRDNLSVRAFALAITNVLKERFNLVCRVSWKDEQLKKQAPLLVKNRDIELNCRGDLTRFITEFARVQLNYGK